MIERYFSRNERGDFVIRAAMRSALSWETMDVFQRQPPGKWDLILCRNMSMYMKSHARLKLWQVLQTSLKPGGHLVLGKAERPDRCVELAPAAPCVYRRMQ